MSPAGSNVEPVRLLLLQAESTVDQISKGGWWGTFAVSPLVTAAWVRLQKSLGFLLSTLQERKSCSMQFKCGQKTKLGRRSLRVRNRPQKLPCY